MQAASAQMYQQAGAGQPGVGACAQGQQASDQQS
jgi:hypothetical protein